MTLIDSVAFCEQPFERNSKGKMNYILERWRPLVPNSFRENIVCSASPSEKGGPKSVAGLSQGSEILTG